MWSYEPNNLLALRVNKTHGGIVKSSVVDYVYPTSGFVKAYCDQDWLFFGDYKKNGEILPSYFTEHEIVDPICSCGIYGFLHDDFTGNIGSGYLRCLLLIEYSGKVVIGEKGIVRGESAQVVFSVDQHSLLDRDRNFHVILANPTIASYYFDIPVISLEEALQLINQQKEKWLT